MQPVQYLTQGLRRFVYRREQVVAKHEEKA